MLSLVFLAQASLVSPGCSGQWNSTVPGNEDCYVNASVPADPSFATLKPASFIVFGYQKAKNDAPGNHPYIQTIFNRISGPLIKLNALIWIKSRNQLRIAQLGSNMLSELVLDFTTFPLTKYTVAADPPIYGPAGSTLHDGKLYCCAGGGGLWGNTTYYPGTYSQF
ncbi:MAG: hypothetical protein M1838_001069 [Thelocarpon superellum]|nr:MAG: hypothetical protein M1838_001069 [Thelocarpon superellum]